LRAPLPDYSEMPTSTDINIIMSRGKVDISLKDKLLRLTSNKATAIRSRDLNKGLQVTNAVDHRSRSQNCGMIPSNEGGNEGKPPAYIEALGSFSL
jgi:hypothetical protein